MKNSRKKTQHVKYCFKLLIIESYGINVIEKALQ